MTLNHKERGELFSLRDHATLTLRVRRGRLWVTQSGAAEDRVLSAGDCLALPANAHTLIEALCPADFELGAARRRAA